MWGQKTGVPLKTVRQREWNLPFSASFLPFFLSFLSFLFSFQTLSGLDDTQQHWLEQSALLSVFTQMLISSVNIFTGIPRNNVNQISWCPMIPSNWHLKLTITYLTRFYVYWPLLPEYLISCPSPALAILVCLLYLNTVGLLWLQDFCIGCSLLLEDFFLRYLHC